MTILTSYRTGTVSLTSGSNIVSGVGTSWIVSGIRVGDVFWANGLSVAVESVTDSQTLVLAFPWSGETLNGVAYEVRYISDAERTLAATQTVLAALRTRGVSALTEVEPVADTMAYFTGLAEAATTPLTEFSRMMLAGANMDEWQQIIGLVAQSNNLDSVIGKVLTVGGFGIGAIAAPLIENINSFTIPAGFYKVDARVTIGVLPPSSDIADGLLVLHPTASQTMQVYLGMTESGRNFIRKSNSDGTWAPWRSIMLDFEFGTGPGSSLDADTVDGYHASDFMLTTDYTESGMLALIKAVDGADSGLDADLLDGLHGAAYLKRGDGLQTVTGPVDWSGTQQFLQTTAFKAPTDIQMNVGLGVNTNPSIVFYYGAQTRGSIQNLNSTELRLTSPAGGVIGILGSGVAQLNSKNIATEEFVSDQLANLDIGTDTAADVLAKVKTVDGVGSELDADLLDGYHASDFVMSSDMNSYALKSGDTFTGPVIVPQLQLEGGDHRISVNDGAGNFNIRVGNTVVGSTPQYTQTAQGAFAFNIEHEAATPSWSIRMAPTTGANAGANITWDETSVLSATLGGDLTYGGQKVLTQGDLDLGSGLDADLLDGVEGSSYARKDQSNIFNATQNIDPGTAEQLRMGENNAAGVHPFISFYNQNTRVGYVQAVSGASPAMRLVTDDGGHLSVEGAGVVKINGATVWHQGNDGAGSGLDADLLDGKHAGDFADSTNSIVGGNGLTGGGNLTASRTISLGTPSSITATSTNSVTTTSHTHALSEGTIRSLISEGNVGELGTYAFLKLISGAASVGANIAGAGLRYSNGGGTQGATPSGTWKCMGMVSTDIPLDLRTTLYLRVA